MNENYIVINGKKIELTEEQLKQLKQLGIEVKKGNPYQSDNGFSPIVCVDGRIEFKTFMYVEARKTIFDSFATPELAEQTFLRELLERKLRAYAYEHNTEPTDWDNDKLRKWVLCYDHLNKEFVTWYCCTCNCGVAGFSSKEIAQNAVREVIEPFMKKHPSFKWGE